MMLKITRDFVPNGDLEVACVSADMLRSAATNLYISSNKWDSIVLELCDELPDDVLNHIQYLSPNKSVILPDKLTDRHVKLLSEFIPEKRGAIRRAYMSGMPLEGVVPVCTEQ